MTRASASIFFSTILYAFTGAVENGMVFVPSMLLLMQISTGDLAITAEREYKGGYNGIEDVPEKTKYPY